MKIPEPGGYQREAGTAFGAATQPLARVPPRRCKCCDEDFQAVTTKGTIDMRCFPCRIGCCPERGCAQRKAVSE